MFYALLLLCTLISPVFCLSFSFRPVRFMGSIAYGVYLLQGLISFVLFKIVERSARSGIEWTLATRLLSVPLVIGVAALSWKYFEKRCSSVVIGTPTEDLGIPQQGLSLVTIPPRGTRCRVTSSRALRCLGKETLTGRCADAATLGTGQWVVDRNGDLCRRHELRYQHGSVAKKVPFSGASLSCSELLAMQSNFEAVYHFVYHVLREVPLANVIANSEQKQNPLI